MKFSDVEDNHLALGGGLGFINDDDFEEEANAQKLDDLVDLYMMKSPATLAMRKSGSHNQGA